MLHLEIEGDVQTMPPPKRKARASSPKPKRSAKQIGIASTPEWADWVREGAEFCRTDVAKMVDQALVDYLRSKGFIKPAPPRV